VKLRLLIAGAVVAALVAAWLVAGKLHRFAYWIGRKSDADIAALAKNGWQVDRLTVAPDVELVGLVRPPKDAKARWILFVPGNSEALLDGFQLELDELRRDEDVGLAFWGYRGFDASAGVPSPAALKADLDAQWRRLVALGAAPERTEIWGYSLGSMLAPHLAAKLCAQKTPPKRLVLLATGPEITIMPHGLFGRFKTSDVYEPLSALALVTCPVVVGQGTADDALPIDGARAVAQRCGENATFVAFDGKGHADLWPEVRRLVW
jgi:pimeloyl-ACP methyl ester carboxylesterase